MNSKTKARMSRKAKARISRKAKIRTRNAESSNDKKMCLREMIDAKPLTKTLMRRRLQINYIRVKLGCSLGEP